MALTVRRLVARQDLHLQLVAGSESAERIVHWAHAIDLPDPTPWLEGGELVMTTGTHLDDHPDAQYRYVRGLALCGCAALAFDTAMRYSEVPEAVCRAGEELGLPIVRVAPQTPFIAISRAVVTEIIADRVRTVQSVVDAQQRFARDALREGISGLMDTLARWIDASVCILGPTGKVLASAGGCQERLSRILHDRAADPQSRRALGNETFADIDPKNGIEAHITVQKIPFSRSRLGHLAARSSVPFGPQERLLLGHAASLLSLELAKPIHLQNAEERLCAATARMILAGGRDVDPTLPRYFNIDPDDCVTVSVISGVGEIASALQHATEELDASGVGYLLAERPDQPDGIVILTPAPSYDSDPLGSLPSRVHHRLRTRLSRPVNTGISQPTRLHEARAALRQAAAAARVSETRGRRPVAFGALGAFHLLIGSQPDHVLRSAIADALGPLNRYDRDRRGSLVASLDAYLRHNGQWEPAAADLGVHRHTLRNRIARIEELLGRDPDSAHVRAELWIALRAREVLPD